ncbi:Gfo/Idh/MocA family protein [Pontiella sp.]|uniref:Gfo/Idh/MocA family protein n=1 Tax=Pontiella sp. TaxID=2837462 RepID=UPI003566A594
MKKLNRRSFQAIGTAAAGASALSIAGCKSKPTVAQEIYNFNIGKPGPSANEKLNIALIGSGNIAAYAYHEAQNENIVARCDVDSAMFAKSLDKHPDNAKAPTFTDFRVMLDQMGKEIDMVCVNTPDHTHFAATMASMERGIHTFTQKPLVHNIWQARTLKKALAKYNVLTNMGNQGHTYNGIRQLREWYEDGIFGQITEVHSWIGGPDWNGPYFERPGAFPPAQEPVPSTLNWDLWQGPTGPAPFNHLYHPKKWRAFHPYGTGTFGDWFCHIADAPVWLLDLYEPVAVEAEEVAGGNEYIVPDGVRVRFDFEKRGTKEACSLYWYNGDSSFAPKAPSDWTWDDKPGNGTFYYGTKNGGYTDARSNNPRLANKEAQRAYKTAGYPAEKYPRLKQSGPIRELISAVKGEIPECGSNFNYAAPFTEVMLLGILAVNHGGRIEWDSKNMRITNRPELNQYLKEPVRKGWEYGEDLWKS